MGEVKIITTNEAMAAYWKEQKVQSDTVKAAMNVINVYDEVQYQKFYGFGGAFTEAAAHIYNEMSNKKKCEIIEACFGENGLCYNMGRIHMNSCDFALGNYTYIDENDASLESFNIEHDKKEIIPMIKDAEGVAGKKLSLLMSPWSPPAFMKTNGDMNHGGKLKKEYYKAWAQYYVKFIKEYQANGMQIDYLTVQNEPDAVQTWDSCTYTAEEEGIFLREYLGPALEEAGLFEIGIFIWDHNKEDAFERMKKVIFDEKVNKYVRGEAVHWYTGDHFEGIELVKKCFPEKEVFFTEGCVEYSRFADSNDVQKAEMYAHDILGNLNAGISASLDWNLLLDHLGGPNHVGNFCAAPILCNVEADEVCKRLTYYYIGHFSRYIKAGARRIATTRYTDKLEVTGFLNPDGTKVIVLLNKSEEALEYVLRDKGCGFAQKIAPHSIQTVVY